MLILDGTLNHHYIEIHTNVVLTYLWYDVECDVMDQSDTFIYAGSARWLVICLYMFKHVFWSYDVRPISNVVFARFYVAPF